MLYTEQLQIFQYNKLYFDSIAFIPGGVANYIGEFINQFFFINHLGGLILTLLLGGIFVLQKRTNINQRDFFISNIFSILPVLIFCFYFLQINSNLGSVVAIIIALGFFIVVRSINSNILRMVIIILFMPLLYFLIGGGFFTYILLVVIFEIKKHKNFIFSVVIILFSLTIPLVVRQFFIALDWNGTWIGTAFYRGNKPLKYAWWIIFSPALASFLDIISSRFSIRNNLFMAYIGSFIISITLGGFYYSRNSSEEILYKLDYFLKKQDWLKMIKIGEEHPQRNLLFTSYINLALLNSGNLSTKLLDFFQHKNVNEFWTPSYIPMFITGETYYYLDMEDAARAYFFMSNTQFPLGRSPYIYKRLAEVELIRGNKEIAMKYIETLGQTLFYKRWSEEMRTAVSSNIYLNGLNKRIEKYRSNKDFLAKEMIYNIYAKYKKEPNNAKVRNFLLAKYLLAKDYNGFISLIEKLPEESLISLGRSFQEMLLMYAYMSKNTSLISKWSIPQNILEDFYGYLQINQSNLSDEDIRQRLKKQFANSYWFYAQYTNEL